MNRNYSKQQIEYLEAKARLDTFSYDDASEDAYCEALDAMIEAKHHLIDWAFEVIREDQRTASKYAANEEELIKLYDLQWKRPAIQKQIIELAMTFDATK